MKKMIANLGFQALLVTQFLEAFNDNAFKLVVGFIAVDQFVSQSGGSLYLALSGVVFILPFLIFSTYAGFLADRFSKQRIMVWSKVAEIVIMIVGLLALRQGNIWPILFVLFLMGTHSAFFSPSKYGILPEILDEQQLSEGNGLIQMWTYAAIILGQAAGGYLVHLAGPRIYTTAYIFIGVSLIGFVTSLFITPVAPVGSQRKFQWNFLTELYGNVKRVRDHRPIFLSIMGLMYFAFLGGLFQLNILLYARKVMGLDPFLASILLIVLAVGVGLGSVLAGKFSDQKIELGLVPLGAMGLSVFSVLLGFVHCSYLSVASCLFLLGLSSGFYIVPLHALIQQESPTDRRGQVLATNNFLSFAAILFGSGILYVLGDTASLNPAQIFVVCGLTTIFGTIYVCRLLPYPVVRLLVWILTHTIYKIRVIDKNNVPPQGAALLVSNHVTFIDAVLIVVTIPRPIRFMISREIYQSSMFRPLFRLARAIPISRKDSPKELIRSLQAAREALKKGELVCIFPEGQLTRTGNLLRFNAGFEHIMKGMDCPIIPVHLDRIWGSIFSFEGGRYLYKWPKIIPYPVTVSFGKPLPATSTAFEVRCRVMELGADAFQYRLADKVTLPEAFWREARRHPGKFCIADSSGRRLNYGRTLISAVALARKFRGKFDQEKAIGIMLPPSVAGVLVNMAVSIINRVPVNLNYTASKEALASVVRQCAMQYVITSRAFIEKTTLSVNCEMIFIEEVMASLTKFDWLKAWLKSLAFPRGFSHWLIFGNKSYRQREKFATIMFTSGSTGEPKGVILTHANITSNLEGLYQVFHIHDRDVLLGILPFFHSFGFTATLWFPLISGIGAVYHVNPLEAKVIGKLVHEYQATILMSTPTFLNSYIRRCEPEQFQSLRMVTVGAEKLKESLAAEFHQKFGVPPLEGYGCTELSPVVSMNLPDYDQQGLLQKAQKPGKIGLPLPGIAARIVDQNSGQPVGPDQEGLLLIKGPNVMKGYLNRPDQTGEVIKEGWYLTGDVATMDEDGFLMITDRLSRFSKMAGEMVPHIKIEEAIHAILKSSEQMAVVTSIPDDKRGERLVVFYTRDMDVSALREALKQAGLPNLWIPDRELFYKIDALPLLGSGKLDLATMKRKAQELSLSGGLK